MVTRKQRGQASRAGLTLVEVILALVILGTALTALIAAASRALSVVRQAKKTWMCSVTLLRAWTWKVWAESCKALAAKFASAGANSLCAVAA